MAREELTTNEKIDLILKYQKSARRWAVFHGIISFIFFLVFIVLPVVGTFYLFDYIKSSAESGKYDQYIEQIRTGQDQLKQLPELLNKLPK
ncbi:hypothetical protein JXA05_01380 [Candidatus Peregrinibacteria bacterium]|nr:hypothetical protein [Candidatus Peregrinibacteria bacterium]